MGRQALKYGAGLIGLYIVVFYGSNLGNLFVQGSKGAVPVIRAFQGR